MTRGPSFFTEERDGRRFNCDRRRGGSHQMIYDIALHRSREEKRAKERIPTTVPGVTNAPLFTSRTSTLFSLLFCTASNGISAALLCCVELKHAHAVA